MTDTEIKKELYRQNPEANLRYIRKGVAYYYADLEKQRVDFEVPIYDMGNADFTPRMDVKIIFRWLINKE